MSQKVIRSSHRSSFEVTDDTDNWRRSNNAHIQEGDREISEREIENPAKTPERQTQTTDLDEDEDQPDISCGIGPLRTSIFGRRFANLYVFSICFALSNFFTSMVDQVITVQLTSLERQFNIDNVRAGLFQTASRVGFMSTVLFAGHFAKKSHIPLIIGAFGVLQGIFLTIPAIMQVVEPYNLPLLPPAKHGNSSNTTDFGDNGKYLCHPHVNGQNVTEPTSTTQAEVKQIQFIVVLVVQAAKGISDTFHNGFLPTLFMDDNLMDKSKMGVFLGIWQVISELSGPIGKQINGILTKVPIDLTETEMDPNDKRFVSAWWLAFLVFGLGTAVFSMPIMLFPRKLISSRQRQEALTNAVLTFAGGEVEDEVVQNNEDKEDVEAPTSEHVENEQHDAPDFSGSKRRHYSVRNQYARSDSKKSSKRRRSSGESRFSGSRRPSLFPPVVGPTERKVSIAGDLVFDQPIKDQQKKDNMKDMLKDFPRALVRVMRRPVFVLLLVDVAIVSVPLSGISIFRNAYMSNEYNVSMSDVALVSGITTALGHIFGTLVSSAITSRIKTRMGYMYVITSTYILTLIIMPFYFIIGCNNEPVYGAEGPIGRPLNNESFLCACSQEQQLISCGGDGRNYYSPCYAGCEDVDGKDFIACGGLNSTTATSVTPGLCSTDCRTSFITYAVLHGTQNFFSAMAMIPRRLLILRIVDPQDRGFATSMFMFCYVLMAIPSPNLFGKVIDDTCLISDGSVCSVYDRDKIRYLMSGIDLGVHGCIQITFMLMMCIFKWEESRAKKKAKKEVENRVIEVNVNPTET